MTDDDYATDNESLCEALGSDERETIRDLAEARGQTSGGVVKAGVLELADRYEGHEVQQALEQLHRRGEIVADNGRYRLAE